MNKNIQIPFNKLAAPAQRALKNAGYENLRQLALMLESDVAMLHGIGPNALAALRRELAANNLSFKIIMNEETFQQLGKGPNNGIQS